jgi:putative PIG3 family NAD(P)H quinone oxidoreductase
MLGPMRAVVITRPGEPEVLQIREVADPSPGPSEVLVDVRATALNRADLLQRRGRYPAPPDAPPDIPGLEFAGQVESCGTQVRSVHAGDRVMGLLGGGGHASKVALHHRLCLAVPPTMDWAQAAAIPEAYLTAYDALFTRGRLAAGETLLVQAAASGVGIAALQLGTVAGANVIGLCRTSAKRERLERAGCGTIIDPGATDATDQVLRASRSAGVDLILDLVGASAWPLHERVLRSRGRIVVLGLLGGSRCELDLAVLLAKRATLVGSVLRSRPLEEKIALTREFARCALPLFAAGRLTPWVDRCLPLEEIAQAHSVMERNENLGKIVLTVEQNRAA